MPDIRAVLFDFGGTLYDYATLEPAERESLVELAHWAVTANGSGHATRATLRCARGSWRRSKHCVRLGCTSVW
jgi:FMN phosphatase YigB (HAD superfamily)